MLLVPVVVILVGSAAERSVGVSPPQGVGGHLLALCVDSCFLVEGLGFLALAFFAGAGGLEVDGCAIVMGCALPLLRTQVQSVCRKLLRVGGRSFSARPSASRHASQTGELGQLDFGIRPGPPAVVDPYDRKPRDVAVLGGRVRATAASPTRWDVDACETLRNELAPTLDT